LDRSPALCVDIIADALDAVVRIRVSRDELRRTRAPALLHALPEWDRLPRVIAGSVHVADAQDVGLGFLRTRERQRYADLRAQPKCGHSELAVHLRADNLQPQLRR